MVMDHRLLPSKKAQTEGKDGAKGEQQQKEGETVVTDKQNQVLGDGNCFETWHSHRKDCFHGDKSELEGEASTGQVCRSSHL